MQIRAARGLPIALGFMGAVLLVAGGMGAARASGSGCTYTTVIQSGTSPPVVVPSAAQAGCPPTGCPEPYIDPCALSSYAVDPNHGMYTCKCDGMHVTGVCRAYLHEYLDPPPGMDPWQIECRGAASCASEQTCKTKVGSAYTDPVTGLVVKNVWCECQ